MILSRTMQPSDFEELSSELSFVDHVTQVCGGWRWEQHLCRRWEYALAYRTLEEWMEERFPGQVLHLVDVGAGIGLWAPMVLSLGHDVVLMEQWAYCQWQETEDAQCRAVKAAYPNTTRGWTWQTSVGLGGLSGWGKEQFHAAFCISTLEHIADEAGAFADLLSMVRPGGLVFLTMDFTGDVGAESAELTYEMHWMRERIYTPARMRRLTELAAERGFETLGPAEWNWSEDCRIVKNYGFSSLALVRDKEPSR